MRRTLAFIALWFAAGALAVAVATAGVAVVSDQLTGSRSHPDPLSTEEVSAAVAADSTTTTLDGTTSTTTTTVVDPADTTTSTTVGGTQGTTVPTTPPPPPTTAPAPPTTKSYNLVGGTATLRFSASGVTVVAATPAAGYTVDIGESHDGGVRVEFESDSHQSRLDAWWAGGPQDEVREDADT